MAVEASLTSVQFDMLLLANKNMIRYKRTWYNYPRSAEIGWLRGWFRRSIGLSWLDDNRGTLKKRKWVNRWQSGKRGDGGIFRGSEARGQFTWKTVSMFASRGIIVFRGVYALTKKSSKSAAPSTATRKEIRSAQDKPLQKTGENPFIDSSFRKKKGLKPDPPFRP